MWWKIKAMVKRIEDARKELLGARDKDVRERCLEVYKKLKVVFIKVKRRSKNI